MNDAEVSSKPQPELEQHRHDRLHRLRETYMTMMTMFFDPAAVSRSGPCFQDFVRHRRQNACIMRLAPCLACG